MSTEKQCFLEMTQQLTHGLNTAVCTRLVPSTRVHGAPPQGMWAVSGYCRKGLSLCSVVEQLIRCPCLRELCDKEGVKI